ncbi:unnamed protein product [Withania somnifera]
MEFFNELLTIFCTTVVVFGGGFYYFSCLFGSAEQKGKTAVQLSGGSLSKEKVQEEYEQYWSFFKRGPNGNDMHVTDKVPALVDTFYNLVTDIYEWGWGQSFHFSPHRILDVGCGVGGPMRAIAAHSGANIVGITINEYRVKRARAHNKKAGLDSLCEVVCGNFLEMPFDDDSFDGAYSIEATCHAPKLEEWVTTELYDSDDPEHVEIICGIERGDALPGLRSYKDIAEIATKVGFEIVKEKDLAKPPAEPWWTRLQMGKIAYWRNHIVVTVLSWLGIAPKGVTDVHDMLFVTADYLAKGGDTGIFSPMHMILCRKPE